MAAIDAVGRQKYAPYGHRIAALVVCRGVPLKIAHDPALFAEVPPFTARSEFRINAGAVDAELSLLALPNYPTNAFVPNPLFQDANPTKFELGQVVRVARLDGPTACDAMMLVDRAVAAERTGLLGRAYVDLSDRDPVGNAWLEAAARQLGELGFDPAVDRAPATMAAGARFDAPVIYFGWYSGNIDEPFLLPGFQFPTGAIALHIHSYSALTLRSATSGWTGPFVARGVTATVGNVNEPYLAFTHQPQLLLRALARGQTLAEAAYFALQALSWQAILIGDPLYRRFAVPLSAQLEKTAVLPRGLAGYAVLRRMHELDAAGKSAEATALVRSAEREAPSLAGGVALAERLRKAGDLNGAANALGFAPLLDSFPSDQWGLAHDAAALLEACGRPARALELWRTLLATPDLPSGVRLPWLRAASVAAAAAGDAAQAALWCVEFEFRITALKEVKKQIGTQRSGCRAPEIVVATPASAEAPRPFTARRSAGITSDLVDDLVGEAVVDRFLGVQVEIPIGVPVNLLDRLARGLRQDVIQLGAELFHFLRLNVDVARRADHAAGDERLVNQDARMGVEQTTTLGGAAEQDGTHRGGHAGHHDRDGRRDEIHRVVNRHAGGDRASGRVEEEGDVLARLRGFQIQELFGDVFGGFVGDRAPEENLPLIQELPLDHHRDRGVLSCQLRRFLFVLLIIVIVIVEMRHRGGKSGLKIIEMHRPRTLVDVCRMASAAAGKYPERCSAD